MTGAGDLDRQIVLQYVKREPDETGDVVEDWKDLATVWANKRDVSGRERVAAQQRVADRTALFTIRWRGDLTPMNRIVYDGKIWDIKGLAEVGRRQWLEITAEAQN